MDSSKHTFQEIAHLILLSRYGKAEKWQILELEEWLKKSEENRNFYDKVLSRSYLEEGLEEYIQYDADDAWKQLKTKMHPRKRRFLVRVFPYVAILVVIIGLVFLWQTQDSEPIQRERVMTAILPGSSKAQLVLSNGRQIELEAKKDKLCRRIEGENFENTGKLLDYRQQKWVENTVQIHTLRIPRGTSGGLQPFVPVGTYVAAGKSIGFDGVLDFYAGSEKVRDKAFESELMRQLKWKLSGIQPYVVSADPSLVKQITQDDIIRGVTIAANGFYGPQGRKLRLPLADPELNRKIEAFEFNDSRITNFEMESSSLAGLSALMGHRAMTVCCIIAGRVAQDMNTEYKGSMTGLIETVLDRI